MSDKIDHDWTAFDGLSVGDTHNNLPIQTLPNSRKTKKWRQATVDALERIGLDQLRSNIRFSDYRKMTEGLFTYSATGFEDNSDFDLPWFNKEVRTLRQERHIPTYIKHFDFIGIVVNALSGIYSELDDRFRVESIDEYSTNEYIRQKTEMLHTYAQQTFIAEVNRLLLQRGIDVNKSDFQSQEEQQAYQLQIQDQTKALTPAEIEQNLSKNFKVIATEWAQNVLTADKKRFYLADKEREEFVSYLLTGRYFRHFRVGYDAYYIESWRPEECFFSQDADARYPQDGEFAGRISEMSISSLLSRFGHLMTAKQQEGIGNYWNQTSRYENSIGTRTAKIFPQPTQVPFHNYFDHQANVQLEEALGVPLAIRTEKNSEGELENMASWTPRLEDNDDLYDSNFSQHLRSDIEVRRDTVRVCEGYWRSYKRMSVLIYTNKFGTISIELTTDDLLDEFLEENEIKKVRTISLQELQTALRDGNLDEHIDTVTYFYAPEVWKFVKIRGNGSTLKDNLYLAVEPLEYQIKGDSNVYDVKLPVTGIIDVGIATKLAPYQQLHNICMNQITELLEKELGVFFTFDITGLPSEYQDETTQESLNRVREDIRDTGLLGLDLSRQNTAGNQVNVFQRQEIVYATQVQYRWTLAQQYKQEALSQIGITPQLLGQPNIYTSAEGVKQGVQASYALINHLFDKMNTSKAKGMEVHLAIAQYCEVNGKDNTTLIRKSDGDHAFLNIIAEDEELFPLRRLGVHPETNSNDRKIVEQIKQFVLQDNTVDRTLNDAISILTNPVLAEIKQIANEIEAKTEAKIQKDREFQQQQLQTQLEAQSVELQKDREWEEASKQKDRETKIEVEQIDAYGRAMAGGNADTSSLDRLDKITQRSIDNDYRADEINIKQEESQRKNNADVEHNKRELQKLAIQTEKLKLEREKLKSQERVALYNKN